MKFLSLFVAAVAATRLRSQFVDGATAHDIMNHCDRDNSGSVSKKEAHDCLNAYVENKYGWAHKAIDEHWPQLAGADGEATLREIEAAMSSGDQAASGLAQALRK